MIAEIAVLTIEDDKIPLIEALVPLGTLVSLQLIIAWLALKNQTIRRWFDGSPSILVRHGKLDREEMKKQKYNLDDLLLQLRMKDVADLREVDFAILETNGILTVFKKGGRTGRSISERSLSLRSRWFLTVKCRMTI